MDTNTRPNYEDAVWQVLGEIGREDTEAWIVRYGGSDITLRTTSPAGDDEYVFAANDTIEKLNQALSPVEFKIYSCTKYGFNLVAK